MSFQLVTKRTKSAFAAATLILLLFLASACSKSNSDSVGSPQLGGAGTTPTGSPDDTKYTVPSFSLDSVNVNDCHNPFSSIDDLESDIKMADTACVRKIIEANHVNLNQPLVDVFGKQSDFPLVLALSDSAVFFGSSNKAVIQMPALLIALGADPNYKTSDGQTILELAINLDYGKYGSIAHYLVQLPAVNVDQKGQSGTPLEAVIGLKIKPLISHLITHGANVNITTKEISPLLQAIQQKLETSAIQLVDAGADVTATDRSKDTPLHNAITLGQNGLAKKLIEKNSPLNAQDNSGASPLYLAAQMGANDIAALLIQRKCDLELKDSSGETALFVAAETKHADVLESLLTAGASVNQTNTAGSGILSVTTDSGLALRLLQANTPAEVKSQSGETALSVHARLDNIDVVKQLVKQGGSLNWQDKSRRTLLHVASASNALRTADFLLTSGLNSNAQTTTGESPLFKVQSIEMLSLLLKNGANINLLNNKNQSALLSHVTSGMDENALLTAFFDRGADINWGEASHTTYLIELLKITSFNGSDAWANQVLSTTKILLARSIVTSRVDSDGDAAIHYLSMNPSILANDTLIEFCKAFRDAGANLGQPDSGGSTLKNNISFRLADTSAQYEKSKIAANGDAAILDTLKKRYEPTIDRLTKAIAQL